MSESQLHRKCENAAGLARLMGCGPGSDTSLLLTILHRCSTRSRSMLRAYQPAWPSDAGASDAVLEVQMQWQNLGPDTVSIQCRKRCWDQF